MYISYNSVKHSVTKFAMCRSVTFFIEENFGHEKTRIHFIGLKGEFTPSKREPVITTYELVPAASKNSNPSEDSSSSRTIS